MRYFAIALICFLIGCQSNKKSERVARFHDDGRAKPVVTIVPVIDSTYYNVPWSISEEFTNIIKNNISKQGNIYFGKENSTHLSTTINPFGKDISWAKDLSNTEFLVFLELIEHEDVPIVKTVKNPNKIPEIRRSSFNLNISMRIRIIDVRKRTPQIVLQEKIKENFYIANNIEKPNYNTVTLGTKEYKRSPLSKAHTKFSKKIIDRISDYIMLAKSR